MVCSKIEKYEHKFTLDYQIFMFLKCKDSRNGGILKMFWGIGKWLFNGWHEIWHYKVILCILLLF